MSSQASSPGLWAKVKSAFGFAGGKPAAVRSSFHAAAAYNRLNLDWIMGPSSADEEVKADLRRLRDRARELRRDNPWAARYVHIQTEGILGPHGVTLQVRTPNSRGGTNESTNRHLEHEFAEWAANHADVGNRLTFREHERLLVETWKSEGEHFIQLVPMPLAENPFGFALQALDADQIDESLNRQAAGSANEIRMGVELDARKRPVAYHVWSEHPNATASNRVRNRIPAEQIIHIGKPTRPGQTRFITPYAPVLQLLKMVGGMQEAILVLQRTSACKMGFFVPNESYSGPMLPQDDETRITMEAEPGLIPQLPPGFDFESWDPGQPGANSEAFLRDLLHEGAAGLNVTYASLTGDLSRANYGSNRAGLLSERDGFRADAAYLIRAFHERVYAAWLKWGILSGRLRVAAGGVERYPAVWQPRGFGWIDPEKDMKAALLEVGAGLNSLTRIAAAQARDIEDVLQERQREIQLAAQYGVPIQLSPTKSAGAPDDEERGGASAPPTPNTPRALRVADGAAA